MKIMGLIKGLWRQHICRVSSGGLKHPRNLDEAIVHHPIGKQILFRLGLKNRSKCTLNIGKECILLKRNRVSSEIAMLLMRMKGYKGGYAMKAFKKWFNQSQWIEVNVCEASWRAALEFMKEKIKTERINTSAYVVKAIDEELNSD